MNSVEVSCCSILEVPHLFSVLQMAVYRIQISRLPQGSTISRAAIDSFSQNGYAVVTQVLLVGTPRGHGV